MFAHWSVMWERSIQQSLLYNIILYHFDRHKHVWFMNQELSNSEPNMIIFRKKNTMQSKFSHKNVKTMLCKHVCLPDHRKNKCLVKALTISKSGLSSFSLSLRISVSIASLIASLHAYKSDHIKGFWYCDTKLEVYWKKGEIFMEKALRYDHKSSHQSEGSHKVLK